MQRLLVRQFGPLGELVLPADKNVLLLIGPQASGKSTISELLFYFKSLPEILLEQIYDAPVEDETDLSIATNFLEACRKRFTPEMFGHTLHMGAFALKYQYKAQAYVEIVQKTDERVRVIFSDNETWTATANTYSRFYGELLNICGEIAAYRRDYHAVPVGSASARRQHEADKRRASEQLEQKVKQLFAEDHEARYVPASRSLFTALPEIFLPTEANKLSAKYTLRHFLRTIGNMRTRYSSSLRQMLKERMQQEALGDRHQDIVSTAIEYIEKKILRARYQYRTNDEVLIVDEAGTYVKMPFASSGQQESLWILLLLFVLILDQQDYKAFVVIEEPEAHLYPVAQKAIVELIALFLNVRPGNQVVITTHSPYILAALNNLILARNVGDRVPSGERPIADIHWIDYDQVGAYSLSLENGRTQLTALTDDEVRLLRTEAVDVEASDLMMSDFDKLSSYE